MDIDQSIAKHLGRQNEMRKQMDEMEKQIISHSQASAYRRVLPIVISCGIAACLAFVLFVQPWGIHSLSPLDELKIEAPILSEYRSASPASTAIDAAIEHKDFTLALEKIDIALKSSVEELSEFEDMGAVEDEVILYEKELAESHYYQLQWLHIFTLVRLSRNTEALQELNHFITLDGEHQQEAKELNKRLLQLQD